MQSTRVHPCLQKPDCSSNPLHGSNTPSAIGTANSETLVMDGHMFHPSAPDSGDRVYFELLLNGHSSIAFIDLRDRSHGSVTLDRPEPCEPAVAHDGSKLAFVSLGELYLFDGRSSRKLKTPAFAHDPSFAPGDRELVYVAGGPDHSQIVRHRFGQLKKAPCWSIARRNWLARRSRPTTADWRSPHDISATGRSGPWISYAIGKFSQPTAPCNSWAPTWGSAASELIFASDCKRGLNLPALFRMSLMTESG